MGLVLLFSLLALPAVQSGIASFSAKILSKRLHTNITIDKVIITPGLTVVLKDLKVHDSEDKTIMDANRLDITRFQFRREARNIRIASAAVDSLICKIHTTPGDTISNLSALIKQFSSDKENDTTALPWTVSIGRISLNNIHFENRNFNEKPIPSGIDWNHNIIDDLHGEIKYLFITDTLISAQVRHLDFKEISGLTVSSLQGRLAYSSQKIQLQDLQIKTPHSSLDFNYTLSYNDMNAFKDFINQVHMEGTFNHSRLDLEDLVLFAPELKGLGDFAWLSGSISGPVNNLKGSDLEIMMGGNTRLLTNFSVSGLPDIENTFFNINIKHLYTTPEDITSFSLPSTDNAEYLKLPENLDSLNFLSLKGFFTGSIKDFVAEANMKTNLGNVITDIQLSQNNTSGELEYDGIIRGYDLEAGILSQQYETLGSLDINMDLKGHGTNPKTMNVRLDGTVDSLWFMGNQLNSIAINASYKKEKGKGRIVLHDELANVDINGLVDFNSDDPYTNLTVAIENADLYRLHITDTSHKSVLTTTLVADAYGFDPDKINGTLTANNLSYVLNGDTLNINTFEVEQKSVSDSLLHKVLTIRSDIFDMYSTSSIPYMDFVSTITQYMENISPELMRTDTASEDEYIWSSEDFIANIKLKNTSGVARLFMPSFGISSGTMARLEYDGKRQTAGIEVTAKKVLLGGITIDKLELESEIDSLRGDFRININEIVLMEPAAGDSVPLGLQNFMVTALAQQDTVHLQAEYDDFSIADHNKGFLNAYLSLSSFPSIEIAIKENFLTFNDSTWRFHPNNNISIAKGINEFVNVGLASKSQGFIVDGKISANPNDTLHARFNNMDLQVLDIFLPEEIRFDGLMNGFANVSGIYDTPNLLGNLSVDDFTLNNQHLGDLLAVTTWNTEKKHIDVNADLIYTGNIGSDTTLFIHGYYAPTSTGFFDFDIGMKNFNVEVAKPWLDGVANNISGRMSGKLKAKGTPSTPEITGKLAFFRTGMKIDYTKVDYTFADEIYFMKNAITFKDFVINDSKAKRLIINGGLNHNYFDDFELDMDLEFQELNVLHTTSMDNTSFYGNVYTSGNMQLNGPLDQMTLNANISTVEGTNVHVPVTYSVDVSSNDFITFVSPYDTLIQDIIVQQDNSSGINIDTRIQVDPNTNMLIYLPDNMGRMEVNGYGDIRFLMDEQSNYEIFGDYEIASGTFLFTLQNVIRREFDIREGGTIKLAGDAMDAVMNVEAVYHLRAGLGGLPTADTTLSSRRVPVECILGLSGPVTNPIINFSIDMPDADEQIRDLVFSTIDTTNNTVMTQQMLSLLILNSFTFSNSNSALTSGLGSTSFDILTNQLSNWLSQISKDFDVGINYRPGDEITQEEVEVALRTQLFNDRVIIDGNIGVMGTDNTENASNIVGDVNVEVKMTKDGRLRLKAFNKSNEQDVLNDAAPYTQGVGVSYFTEFDNFGELFRRRRPKNQKRN